MSSMVPPEVIGPFREKVFAFFSENRRSFPWRETTDRYAIMVSEIMLQQTQAERVIPKYTAWIDRFPDVATLSYAPLREVLSLWSGLGYNSRGQRLQLCARAIVERFDGIVPATPSELKTLPGIGDYTCRSIPVFADNLDAAAVDTNIRRIIIHEFALPEETSKRSIQIAAEQLLPPGRSRDWHNALMDYGSLFLTSRATGIRPLTKQSKFRGSKRWYRGRLLKELVASEQLLLEEIEERYGDCPWGMREIIDALVRDGLVDEIDNTNAGGMALRIRE
ncbi:MAG: Fe-S cluster assembly protein HesB [Chlorobium sp.]|uniref:Fe-S cluster assembly protein HesB n=2 Tax=Chlorobium sp. TaxID=1095 RepID=UPI0025C4B636|nr:Fe-S cluster assembly protein HesB [Chlorobium sp.]MCF8216215.1 Fe-S cluster assembly protein HesB [Chlorobium sp.]MCF8271117.1 Fe-S cluster assembly protein HesB [Chlorobium sp.]MCF8287491.1 Fe-S cluster assembly protein HesB [Chlorobium sp.]MCF8291030.1 Fe-S cluster assembly protein HesB [Chlorobium sp.]MCF8385125.1 Fe-S cluster assembly protein HesB [Chlorobium sp.]